MFESPSSPEFLQAIHDTRYGWASPGLDNLLAAIHVDAGGSEGCDWSWREDINQFICRHGIGVWMYMANHACGMYRN